MPREDTGVAAVVEEHRDLLEAVVEADLRISKYAEAALREVD